MTHRYSREHDRLDLYEAYALARKLLKLEGTTRRTRAAKSMQIHRPVNHRLMEQYNINSEDEHKLHSRLAQIHDWLIKRYPHYGHDEFPPDFAQELRKYMQSLPWDDYPGDRDMTVVTAVWCWYMDLDINDAHPHSILASNLITLIDMFAGELADSVRGDV